MNILNRYVLLATLTASLGLAQDVSRAQGYLFQGFGTVLFDDTTAIGHTGGGVDVNVYKGLTAGGDLGVAYPLIAPWGIVGLVNFNGGYHYNAGRLDRKWEPFATAGYSVFFRDGSASAFNYGAGIVYWLKPHVGLRAEVRDYRVASGSAFTEFRIGVSFR